MIDKYGNVDNFEFDDTELKNELGDMPLTEPEILKFVRGLIEEGIQATAMQTTGY